MQIQRALAVGIQDAKLLRHAGKISLKLGDTASAGKYLSKAADLNAPESVEGCAILEKQLPESAL